MTETSLLLPDVVRAPRTDSIYACHSYLTKIPVAAIVPFIEKLTSPGETVVDPFAGSGMTGIAALKLGRSAQLSDISALGQHVASGYLERVGRKALREAASSAMAQARTALGDLYLTRRAVDLSRTEMVRTVWSFTYVCPKCDEEILYFDWVRPDTARGEARCLKCSLPLDRRRWTRRRELPVQVVVRSTSGRLLDQAVQEVDLDAIHQAAKDPRQSEVPSLSIGEGREMFHRSALAKHGLTETRCFFSPRNALALLELWRAIGSLEDEPLRDKLSFAFTAILSRASRRYQWGPKRPLNAQNQTFYIAPVHYEWNVFELFGRKVEAVIRSDEVVFGADEPQRSHNIRYMLTSANALTHLSDRSADYVFTDPPFGSNIFYSDMHLFHEAWLGSVTDARSEAVVRTAGRVGDKENSAKRYEALMRGAFTEAFRVLRPGRYLSVVFGNSKGELWALLLRALADAGFDPVPVHVAILDKGQRSVKGLASGSERVVTVDLVLTVRKAESPESPQRSSGSSVADLLACAVRTLDQEQARNPSYLYAAILREAIRQGRTVEDLSLKAVLSVLKEAGHTQDRRSGLIERPVE